MPSKKSVLEYDVVPFMEFPLSSPLTCIKETNDGEMVLLDTVSLKGKLLESSSQGERGGIWTKEFESFQAFLLSSDLFGMNGTLEADGNITFDPEYGSESETRQTLAQFFAHLGDPSDGVFAGGGVLVVKQLKGSYRDPDALWMAVAVGDDGGDDDDEED